MEGYVMLTSKELMMLQDTMGMSNTMVTFIQACSQNATDPQLKSLCQNMLPAHQKDIQTLASCLTQNLQ